MGIKVSIVLYQLIFGGNLKGNVLGVLFGEKFIFPIMQFFGVVE